jgi:hypothetical protein
VVTACPCVHIKRLCRGIASFTRLHLCKHFYYLPTCNACITHKHTNTHVHTHTHAHTRPYINHLQIILLLGATTTILQALLTYTHVSTFTTYLHAMHASLINTQTHTYTHTRARTHTHAHTSIIFKSYFFWGLQQILRASLVHTRTHIGHLQIIRPLGGPAVALATEAAQPHGRIVVDEYVAGPSGRCVRAVIITIYLLCTQLFLLGSHQTYSHIRRAYARL